MVFQSRREEQDRYSLLPLWLTFFNNTLIVLGLNCKVVDGELILIDILA